MVGSRHRQPSPYSLPYSLLPLPINDPHDSHSRHRHRQGTQGHRTVFPGYRRNGMVYTAGQIAFDPATMEIVAGGIREQTQRVLANLQAVLQAADLICRKS